MNIISNNCLGGFIYKDFLQIKYENPFIFSLMDYDDFLYLLENYETIDKIQIIGNLTADNKRSITAIITKN